MAWGFWNKIKKGLKKAFNFTKNKIIKPAVDIAKKVVPFVAPTLDKIKQRTFTIFEQTGILNNLKDKIILLRVYGELKRGKSSDIKFSKIEEFVKGKEAYFLLRNTHDLISEEQELDLKLPEKDSENIEEETIKVYSEENPSSFNKIIPELMNALSIEKQEGETTETFNNRILQGTKKFFKFPN